MHFSADLQTFLHTLPAGSQVVLAFVTLSEREATVSAPARFDHSLVKAGGDHATHSARVLTLTPGTATPATTVTGTKGYRAAQQLLEQHKASLQAATFTPAAWAKRLGLFERELRRAIYNDALQATKKTVGKDHGAYLVYGADLRCFVDTVVDVELGVQAKPSWWDAVRLRSA